MPLSVLHYPDPLLHQACDSVDDFGDNLRTLVDNLFQTMYAAPGLGMTAAHVGIQKRIVIVDLDAPNAPQTFINPQIVDMSDTLQTFDEGSVCMPGATAPIKRPDTITMTWQDVDGKEHDGPFTGFMATVLQHEIDQLNGMFWLDRLSKLKRDMVVKRWRKLEA